MRSRGSLDYFWPSSVKARATPPATTLIYLPMLSIGFDAKRLFHNFTGLGNYSRTLVRNLLYYHPEPVYHLFTPTLRPHPENHFFAHNAAFNVITPRPGQWPGLWRARGMVRQWQRQHLHLYHGLSNELPWGPYPAGVKTVVTLHDLLFHRFPEQYRWVDRQIYTAKFQHAAQRADRIVAISAATKNDLVEFYQVDPAKITIIYQACDERFLTEKSPAILAQVRQQYQLPETFLLYVGSIIARKNLLGIVQALLELPPSQRLPLVVVGSGKAYLQTVLAFIQQHRLAPWVHFRQVSNADLPAVYQLASIFLYPSHGEGFGIPILEALCSRTPVITSNVSSLPEAAGLQASLIDPADPAAIAQSIVNILHDPLLRENMREQGFRHAQKFRGEPLSQELMDLYRALTGLL